MRTRRRYLALAGAALGGLSGCLGDGSPGSDDGNSDTTPDTTNPGTTNPGTTGPGTTAPGTSDGTTDAPTDGPDDLAVTNLAVKEAVTFYEWPASTRVIAPSDEQFVLATVEGQEEEPAPQFAFEAGGDSWEPGLPDGYQYHGPQSTVDGRKGGLVAGDRDAVGYLAFTVPSPLSADDPTIVLNDGDATWDLPDEAVEQLARPSPTFSLEILDVPETVAQGESLSVSLTVRNEGDVDGRFLASVKWPTAIADDDESTIVSGSIAAGETETFSLDLLTNQNTDGTEEVPLTIWGCVEREVGVMVQADDTTSAFL